MQNKTPDATYRNETEADAALYFGSRKYKKKMLPNGRCGVWFEPETKHGWAAIYDDYDGPNEFTEEMEVEFIEEMEVEFIKGDLARLLADGRTETAKEIYDWLASALNKADENYEPKETGDADNH